MWDDYVEEAPGPEAAPPAEAKPAEPAAEEKKDAAQAPAPETTVMGEDPKQLLYKHWIRPKFFQYGYLYDYQHNYYNDVISYMDRRNKGLPTERPRAQTWGERVLRTYLSKAPSHSERTTNRDTRLLRHISTGAKFQRYHIKSLISRKYSKLGFNQVSI